MTSCDSSGPAAACPAPQDVRLPPSAADAEILRRRARGLARPSAAGGDADGGMDVVEFRLAGEAYALLAGHIVEVRPLRFFAPVPCLPPFYPGVMNLRGRIVPVLDLRRFFDLPAGGIREKDRVVVLGDGILEVAVLADEVSGARRLPAGALSPPPAAFTGIHSRYLAGFTADGLAVLDGGRILADKTLMVDEGVAAVR